MPAFREVLVAHRPVLPRRSATRSAQRGAQPRRRARQTWRPATPTTSRRSRARRSRTARERLEQSYDAEHGGFGDAPKFPHPTTLELLLAHWHAHRATAMRTAQALDDGHAHARLHGAARPLRSARRRLLPLQRRSVLVDPALREDALRQRRSCSPSTPTRTPRRATPRYASVAGATADWVHARHAGRARRLSTRRSTPTRSTRKASSTSGRRPSSTRARPTRLARSRSACFGLDAPARTSKASTGICTSPRRPRRPPRRSGLDPAPSSRSARRARAASCSPRASNASGRGATRSCSCRGTGSWSRGMARAARVLGRPELAESGDARRRLHSRRALAGRPPQSHATRTAALASPPISTTTRSSRTACSSCLQCRWRTSDLDLRARARRRAARAFRGRRAAASSSRPTITSA